MQQTAPARHALCSPSSAHKWIRCPGSLAMEKGIPNRSSKYADEGTKAHDLAAKALLAGGVLPVDDDTEMLGFVNIYVDNVMAYAEGNDLLVEQEIELAPFTHEEGAVGTSDAVILTADGNELQVHDLKYGQGVQVSAEHNEQMMLYALGALNQYSFMGHFESVRMVIHQVRIRKEPDEWVTTRTALFEWAVEVLAKAEQAQGFYNGVAPVADYLNPGDKQCRFCLARGSCPALRKFVEKTLEADFEALDAPQQIVTSARVVSTKDAEQIAALLPHLDLIETWVKAVRERARGAALNGEEIPGYKLVEGKRGNREWMNPAEAEEALLAMRYKQDQVYNQKLISPTDAEKLIATANPRRWNKIKILITRSDGKPVLVPQHDKRPAMIAGEGFTNLNEQTTGDANG